VNLADLHTLPIDLLEGAFLSKRTVEEGMHVLQCGRWTCDAGA
jgi:hypothetical protein